MNMTRSCLELETLDPANTRMASTKRYGTWSRHCPRTFGLAITASVRNGSPTRREADGRINPNCRAACRLGFLPGSETGRENLVVVSAESSHVFMICTFDDSQAGPVTQNVTYWQGYFCVRDRHFLPTRVTDLMWWNVRTMARKNRNMWSRKNAWMWLLLFKHMSFKWLPSDSSYAIV